MPSPMRTARYCGECGGMLSQVAVCPATGEPHASMTLFASVQPHAPPYPAAAATPSRPHLSPQHAAEGESGTPPQNPLDLAFGPSRLAGQGKQQQQQPPPPATETTGDTAASGAPPGERGVVATALAQATASVREAVASVRGAGGKGVRHGGGPDAESESEPFLHRQSCMQLPYVKVAKASLGLTGVVAVLLVAAIAGNAWYEVVVRVTPLEAGLPSTDAMRLEYGFLQLCNTTLGSTECTGISFDSVRCSTEDAAARATGSHILLVVMLVGATAVLLTLCVSLCRPAAHAMLPALLLAESLVTTLSGVVSCGLFMTTMQKRYCNHDLCELLSWQGITVSQPQDLRTGSCTYGASLFLAWLAAAFSMAVTAAFFLYLLLYNKPVPRLLHGLNEKQKRMAKARQHLASQADDTKAGQRHDSL